MEGKDILSVADLSPTEIRSLIKRAREMKTEGRSKLLAGKVLGILFEKPSLRTRLSFELAMRQLGGEAIYLSPAEVGLGQREAVSDVARVISRYVDAVALRTFAHQTLLEFAGAAAIPVINALSDREHPCQALADILTILESKGKLAGLNLAYVGDGNNVAHSLLLAAAASGINVRLASPPGYEVEQQILDTARALAAESGSDIITTEKPEEAARGADILYTDVWASMGQEAEAETRRRVFAPYQLNEALAALARPEAILMHPLPAHRGEEVSRDILDGPGSVVFDQAENRMHLQKALLAGILGRPEKTPAKET